MGNPSGRPRISLAQRLLSQVILDPSGCVLFTGVLDKDGYGVIQSGGGVRYGSKQLRAHRVMYELFVGPIPENMTLDHLCRVRNCVAIAHLEPVMKIINIKRGVPFRRRLTHCQRDHEFTEENTGRHPNGKRFCKTCQYAANNRYRARLKEARS